MSRLGYINRELSLAAEEDRQSSLTDADVKWAVEWERWDLLEQAGLDPEEVRAEYGAGEGKGVSPDPFGTAGVPRTGTDGMAQTSGLVGSEEDGDPDTEPDDEDLPEDYNDWTVPELREGLRRRQLPADGNKPDLIARLEEDDASQEE